MWCLNKTGLLWIFLEGRTRIKRGEKRKIPIVAYRHVLITACRLTPRARDFRRLSCLDLGSPERLHTDYADTVRIRARRVQ